MEVETLFADLRYAARTMRRAPAFTVVAVLSLAIGIGANTAVFGVLDALLLRSLPVQDPASLYLLRGAVHYPVYQAVREHATSFVDLFASGGLQSLDVEVANGLPERTSVSLVSGSYFPVLGVQPVIGRAFNPADDRPGGGNPVAVVSFGFWQRRFAGDPEIVGRTIRVTRTPITIVGVAPPGFFGETVGAAPDLWIPLTLRPQVVPGRDLLRSPGTAWLRVIARAKPDMHVRETEAALTGLLRRVLTDTFGPSMAEDDRRDIAAATITLVPAHNGVSGLRTQFATPIWILMAAVALVLLIACANVANLLLVRAAARRREIGVRLALGMSRGRLVRQLLTESLLLAAVGGALGFVLSVWLREILLRLAAADGSRVPLAVATDARVVLFVVVLSLATGVLFGVAPMWQSMRADLLGSLSLRHPGASRRGRVAMNPLLVIGQIALSLVLVAGASLFLRTLSNLRDVDLGFAVDRLFIVDIDPKAAGYRGVEHAAVCRRLLQRLSSLGGVESATLSENGALAGRDSSTNRMRPADFIAGPEGIPSSRYDIVGPGYFHTMRISRLAGRDIEERDAAGAPLVVAINEAMARRFFGEQSALGKAMVWGFGNAEKRLQVIAVVRDVKQEGPREESNLRFYIPYLQEPNRELASVRFLVRAAAQPDAVLAGVREAVRLEDRRLSIASVDVLADLADRVLVRERLIAFLSAAFGTIAVLLACIGLYGLIAHRVVRRTSEIGVRMAFGAARRDVLWMILRQDLALVACGIAIGLPLARVGAALTRGVLFGISADDPATLIAASAALLAAGMLAGLVPAWRATRIEPVNALRYE